MGLPFIGDADEHARANIANKPAPGSTDCRSPVSGGAERCVRSRTSIPLRAMLCSKFPKPIEPTSMMGSIYPLPLAPHKQKPPGFAGRFYFAIFSIRRCRSAATTSPRVGAGCRSLSRQQAVRGQGPPARAGWCARAGCRRRAPVRQAKH